MEIYTCYGLIGESDDPGIIQIMAMLRGKKILMWRVKIQFFKAY